MNGIDPGSDKIKVLIVDDHQIVRQGLRTFLELHEDISVIGEAGDGAAAVQMVQQLGPDVVLMDLMMPGMDGITATRMVVDLGRATKVIALTSFAEDHRLFPAIQAGASSYLLKDVSPDDLVDAIRAAYNGEPRLHPDVARRLMDAMRAEKTGAGSKSGEAASPAADLTDRELQVVRLVARGFSNQDIAREFVLSEKTVKTHISNILGKLGLNDRTQLAIYAIKHGLADRE